MAELLASVEQLRLRYGIDEADLDDDRAELLLRLASAEVRAFTGRLFDATEDETIVLDGSGGPVLILPEVPVVDVLEVLEAVDTDDEEALDGPGTTSPAWEWTAHGTLRRLDGKVWTGRARWYGITFSHGFTVSPDEVTDVVLRVAHRSIDEEPEVKSETIGRYSYTKQGEAAGVGLYGTDRDLLSGYRIGRKAREGTPESGS